jgi:UDP-GlcNAc:undecaprenyl-phosphate/decaprenyl-phosphate GlcNAc-1-phosphate transferase
LRRTLCDRTFGPESALPAFVDVARVPREVFGTPNTGAYMSSLFVVLVVAVVAGSMLTPALVTMATRWKLYDRRIGARHVHPGPVPFVGGVAVFLAMAAGLAAATLLDLGATDVAASAGRLKLFMTVLAGGGTLLLAGLADDVLGLRPTQKLLIQCIAALAVYAAGLRVEIVDLRLGSTFALGGLALPFTVLWIVGITNAFNLIDGLDGLASGVALVTTGTVAAAAIALGNGNAAVVCVALLGALLAFLPYNRNPARIFLGNAGSQFVGFLLAILSVQGSLKSATAVMIVIPLFALAVPLLDVSTAIARRWLRGSPILEADARHLHHRLVAIGLTHARAANVLYVVAGCFAVLGLVLTFAPASTVLRLALGGGALAAVVIVYGIRKLKYDEFAEAGAALASGFVHVRYVVQGRIRARELSRSIAEARSLQDLNARLADAAVSLGFLGMTVDVESVPPLPGLARLTNDVSRAWHLDFPVMPRPTTNGDSYVLRIWCAPGVRHSFGVERAARLLAPTIEAWLVSASVQDRPSSLEKVLTRSVVAGADRPLLGGFPIPPRADSGVDVALPN